MPFVYMLASKPYGARYIGSTFDLARRVLEHKTRAVPGFTAKYDVGQLVWYEVHEALETSLIREWQLKKWKRDWKINLIERDNPHLVDLYPSLGPRALKPLGKLSVGARMGPCPAGTHDPPACAGTYQAACPAKFALVRRDSGD